MREATSRAYSWSYVLGWLAVCFEVLAAVMLFICGACCGPERRKEDKFYDFNTLNSVRSKYEEEPGTQSNFDSNFHSGKATMRSTEKFHYVINE